MLRRKLADRLIQENFAIADKKREPRVEKARGSRFCYHLKALYKILDIAQLFQQRRADHLGKRLVEF